MSGPGGAPFISFLSDYGLQDEFVGVCHGVIARRCPDARVIDLTHSVPRHDVFAGAIILRSALDYLPAGVHLAVVDPEVGAGTRRAVALSAEGGERMLVGPDNGLLMLAADHLGRVREAVDIGSSPERLQPVSNTFHGRDIFAPVAAALAAGAELAQVGEPLDADTLVRLRAPEARPEGENLIVHVLLRDGFGNLSLDATASQMEALGGEVVVRAGARSLRAVRGRTFADVPAGGLLLYRDGLGVAALAVNLGSAADLLGAGPGDELLLCTA